MDIVLKGTYPQGTISNVKITAEVLFTISKAWKDSPYKTIYKKFSSVPGDSTPSVNRYNQNIYGGYSNHYNLNNDDITITIAINNITHYGVTQALGDFKVEKMALRYSKYDPEFYDIVIRVSEREDDSDSTGPCSRFKTQKNLLAEASPWFRNMFLSGMKESTANEVVIRGIHPDIFGRLLDSIRGIDIDIHDIDHGLKLLKAADRLELQKQQELIFLYISMRINCDNVSKIWRTGDLFGYTKTQNVCREYTRIYYNDILKNSSWITIPGDEACNILSIDGLSEAVDETIFYQATLNWRNAAIEKVLGIPNRNQPDLLGMIDELDDNPSTAAREIWFNRSSDTVDSMVGQMQLLPKVEEDLWAIDKHFSQMIQCIRFNQMEAAYLNSNVESSSLVMQEPGIQKRVNQAVPM
ncbi:hypothetical protein CLU79DRAFT_259654 [Phycomyces nitens]|nr:hypothetical protein CLU79DRAFT_259654 [Phycomyces nitens]